MRNTHPGKHSVLRLERLTVNNTGCNPSSGPALDLRLRSADLLIRNCFFSHATTVDSAVVSLQFDPDTTSPASRARITQNSFVSCSGGGVVLVNNTGETTARLTMTKNSLIHNSINDTASVVKLVNVGVAMTDNLFHNNSGRHLVEIGSEEGCLRLPVRADGNVFWLNTALEGADTCAVSLNASDVTFRANIFNNPSNVYELSAQETGDTDGTDATVDCANNWWGSGLAHVVTSRIRDGSKVEGLPTVVWLPFETVPPSGIHFSSKHFCLLH